ncbi:MAG: MMPL family transporter, partial [Delftia sp.]|nr:MMPL family transporter [Delftia sp.]
AEAAFLANIARAQVTVNVAAITVIMLSLWWAYRCAAAVLSPLLTTGLSVTATFGFLSLAGFPITPYTALTPAFILVIGSTEDMHMLSRYFHHLREGQNQKSALVDMARHCLLPITLTALTTIVGFGALCLNEAAIIRQFGFAMVFGLGANYLATVITLPAALRLLGVPKVARPAARRPGKFRARSLLNRVIAVNQRRRGVIVVTTLALIGLALAGLPRLTVNNDFTAFFKADAPIRQDLERLNRDLAGASTFNLVVTADAEGDVLEPDVLQRIDRLQAHMASMGVFGRSASLADIVKLMHRERHEGRREMARIPDSRAAVAQYMLLLDDETVSEYVDA